MNLVTIEVICYAIRIRRRNAKRFREMAPNSQPADMLMARAAALENEADAMLTDLYRYIKDDQQIAAIRSEINDDDRTKRSPTQSGADLPGEAPGV